MKKKRKLKQRSVERLYTAARFLLDRSAKQVVEAGVRVLQCKRQLAQRGKGKL